MEEPASSTVGRVSGKEAEKGVGPWRLSETVSLRPTMDEVWVWGTGGRLPEGASGQVLGCGWTKPSCHPHLFDAETQS